MSAAAQNSGGGTVLELERVTIRFGGLTAVSEVDLAVGEGELVGLIGPNGAGKTTVFNLVTGVYQPTEGRISFDRKPHGRLRPHDLTRRGIARTFQNIRLFGSMSVFDNVRVAMQLHRRPTMHAYACRAGNGQQRRQFCTQFRGQGDDISKLR